MTNPELKQFLESLTNDEVFAILESARVALADADIAFEVGWDLSMGDADINNIQHKVHQFMESL
jgi:hypothetical protein